MAYLREVDFSDLYLEHELENSRIRGQEAGGDLCPVHDDLMGDVKRLYETVKAQFRNMPNAHEFSIPFDDVMYRVTVINDVRQMVFALRRGALKVPPLEECGIPSIIIDRIMGLKCGMVLFAGSFGVGKTTSASAYALAYSMQGGLVITLEDPPELSLSGDHGHGRILQVQINRADIDAEIESTMRMNFDMLFLSEIRTSMLASETINASVNGKLIVSTIHADSAVSAVSRLVSLATGNGSAEKDSAASRVLREMMGQGLAAVLFLSKNSDGQRSATEILLGTQNVKSKIYQGEYSRLQDDVRQLAAQLKNGLPF
ncbi:Flp pilus assembly complex ATPase component TadA [Acidithiobacillus sp. MC6.1]|nr:Flp pilus assembly complex ATPase component TadA [Acidithiobacillus sp. MC6.1]